MWSKILIGTVSILDSLANWLESKVKSSDADFRSGNYFDNRKENERYLKRLAYGNNTPPKPISKEEDNREAFYENVLEELPRITNCVKFQVIPTQTSYIVISTVYSGEEMYDRNTNRTVYTVDFEQFDTEFTNIVRLEFLKK